MIFRQQYYFAKSRFTYLKLYLFFLVIISLTGCQSNSVTFTAKATGYDREITIPLEVITQSKPSPTIIVAHPSDGLNWSRYVMFWGSLIKSWGYNVVLPDSFTTRGYRNKEVMYQSGLVNYHQRAEDLEQVAAWIQNQSWHKGKIGAIGFSHGGGAINRMSNETNIISVGVAYYPGCFYSIDYNPKIPVQIHIGNNDTWTSVGRCQDLIEFSRNKKNNHFDLNVYYGATHAFDIPAATRVIAGHTLSHDPVATKQAEDRTRLFFQKYLSN
jgi:dienelactone hydrolase